MQEWELHCQICLSCAFKYRPVHRETAMEEYMDSQSSNFKVACFSWLVAREVRVTQENLKRRGFQLCSRCLLCGRNLETNSHLFLHCPITRQLWQLFLNIVGPRWTMPATIEELLECCNNNGGLFRQKAWWRLIHACIWWTVWKERN